MSCPNLISSGVDPGVDPTQTPGWQPAAGPSLWATLLPAPLTQAETAEPSTMIAQIPIAAGTFVMMSRFSSYAANHDYVNRFCDSGFVAIVFTTW